MPTRRRVLSAWVPAMLGILITVAAAFPAAAMAHGIGESAADRTILEFIPFGIEHMLLGWDHLLFIAGILLISSDMKMAAKLISVFVVGHSLTLLGATIAGWQLDATAVDVVIALSLVFVGVVGFRGTPSDWRPIGAAIFGFGLVHGLGLATRLIDAGIPDQDIVWRVLMFNLGVEIGQLTALILMVGVGYAIRRGASDTDRFHRPAFAALVGAGLIAAAVLSAPSAGRGGETNEALAGTTCSEGPAPVPSGSLDGGHPDKRFYKPGESVPEEDLAHIVGDGLVIVRYDPERAGAAKRIKDWMQKVTPQIVAAPGAEGEAAMSAVHFQGSISCATIDLDGLGQFTRGWLGDRAVPPGAGV